MTCLILHRIKQLIGIITLVLVVACEQNTLSAPTTEPIIEKVRIEIFARAQSYELPSVRAVEDEGSVSTTPWVLVFKGTDNNATFVEAVQAFEMVSKRYVLLTPQSGATGYQLLILANPMDYFYYGNATTGMTYNTGNLTSTLITGVTTLKQACDNLLSEPLSPGQQTTIPFSEPGKLIPMSHLLSVTKIDNTTQIANNDGTSLELVRAIAKISITNKASNFTLTGITSVENVPRQGRIHNIGNDIMNNKTHLTTYRKDALYSAPAVTAVNNSTENTPVYMYESDIQNNTYFIIQGIYENRTYYYKMALVNDKQQYMDIVRNAAYTFTITKAKGPGYDTVEDAIASKPSNMALDYHITVDDGESYEIMANNDYYMGVSNSVYILYGGGGEPDKVYEAFNVITDCHTAFPNSNRIETNQAETDYAFGLNGNTQGNKIPIVENNSSDPRITPVYTYITEWLMWYEEGIFDQEGIVPRKNAYVTLKLGNLEKAIHIRQRTIIPSSGTMLKFIPTQNVDPTIHEINYYCLSAQVKDGTDDPKTWIKLLPSSGLEREDADNITVDDGIIFIQIKPNATTQERKGIIYLTTIKDPDGSRDHNSMQRIKIEIRQAG